MTCRCGRNGSVELHTTTAQVCVWVRNPPRLVAGCLHRPAVWVEHQTKLISSETASGRAVSELSPCAGLEVGAVPVLSERRLRQRPAAWDAVLLQVGSFVPFYKPWKNVVHKTPWGSRAAAGPATRGAASPEQAAPKQGQLGVRAGALGRWEHGCGHRPDRAQPWFSEPGAAASRWLL